MIARKGDRLVDEHVDQLLTLSSIRGSTDVASHHELYGWVHCQINSSEHLEVFAQQYAVLLNRVLLQCMQEDRVILCRQRLQRGSFNPDARSGGERNLAFPQSASGKWRRKPPQTAVVYEGVSYVRSTDEILLYTISLLTCHQRLSCQRE